MWVPEIFSDCQHFSLTHGARTTVLGWMRPTPHLRTGIIGVPIQARLPRDSERVSDNGKPVVRSGRKATGLTETAGLPKKYQPISAEDAQSAVDGIRFTECGESHASTKNPCSRR